MLITCPICKQICETEQDLAVGQHVVCPFCNTKFSYAEPFRKELPKARQPRILKIASSIYFVLGAILMLGGSASCRAHLWSAIWGVGGVGLLLAAYFMTIGHKVAVRVSLGALGLLALGRILSFVPYGMSELFGIILFIFPVGVCFLRSPQAWLKQRCKLDSRDWFEFVERFKNLPWFMKGICLLLCGVILFNLFNQGGRARETAVERYRREFKEVEARTSHYVCSYSIEVDLTAPASRNGVFGLRWGEKPRNPEHKVPCDVDYPISHGMFNRVKLAYGDDGGLFGVTLHGPSNKLPDFSGTMPRVTQKEVEAEMLETVCLPYFKTMIEIAEQILDQQIKWSYMGASAVAGERFVGVSEYNTDEYFGMVRMDVTGDNAEQLFSVMRKSQKMRCGQN